MDCETRPTNRTAIRSMAKHVRRMFGCRSDDEPFPVLHALELLPDLFPNTTYNIVADTDLPANVFARCYPKADGGFEIEIKQSVYDGAFNDNIPAFLSFICHEICHVVMFYLGYMPISNRAVKDTNKIPPYKSVEWQAKALCGEVTIPYEATIGMTFEEIAEKYHVTKESAKYRVKYDSKKKNANIRKEG